MPDDLYETDIVAWSEHQADRLRRVAAGERVNDVDWPHIIEEIGDLGRSELNAVQSLLGQALIHALKTVAWPGHEASRHWQQECGLFLFQARRRAQPSMAGRIDVADLYEDALITMRALDMGAPPGPVPEASLVTAADLLDRRLDARALIARLAPT